MNQKDLIGLYGLPKEIKFCINCTMSNQRPRITFNSSGVCSACTFAVYKRTSVDWGSREQELVDLLDRHRDGQGEFDVVVPCSGGKDGGFVAHQLKHKYGMRVLTATWAPLRPTDVGRRNLDGFISGGFDHILGTANPRVSSRLVREATLEIGDPFLPFIYGQTNFPIQVAKKYGTSLVFYGENGEVEYGGDMSRALTPVKAFSVAQDHYFSGLPVDFWLKKGFSLSDLSYFMPPKDLSGVEQHFFGYYKFWDPQENFYYAEANLNFTPNPTRSEGTYSRYASLDDKFDGFHYYLMFIKFGIGRATSDSAHEIRDGKISREEGIELVRKYDGEFPEQHFAEFLEFTGLSRDDFFRVVDSWRSPHIWTQDEGGSNSWKLKNSVYSRQ